MVLARLQLDVYDTRERPTGVDAERVQNTWTPNMTSFLCGKIMFNSSNHKTFSTAGVVIIAAVSSAMILLSFTDAVVLAILRRMSLSLRSWEETENLKLLDTAEEACELLRCLKDPYLVTEAEESIRNLYAVCAGRQVETA